MPPKEEPRDAGVLPPGPRPVPRVHPGLQLLDEHAAVEVRAPSVAHACFARRQVLERAALAAVVDRDHDERLDPSPGDQPLRRLVHLPLPAGQEGGGTVEDVLPVLHVEHGEAPLGLAGVLRGQVHPHPAGLSEDRGAEVRVLLHRPGEGVDLPESGLLLAVAPALQPTGRVARQCEEKRRSRSRGRSAARRGGPQTCRSRPASFHGDPPPRVAHRAVGLPGRVIAGRMALRDEHDLERALGQHAVERARALADRQGGVRLGPATAGSSRRHPSRARSSRRRPRGA